MAVRIISDGRTSIDRDAVRRSRLLGLRELIWIVGPVSPGTEVTTSTTPWRVDGVAGGAAALTFSVGNLQRAAAYLTFAMAPLRGPDGLVWSPDATWDPPAVLLMPGGACEVCLRMRVPAGLDPGTYLGSLAALDVSGAPPRLEVVIGSASS